MILEMRIPFTLVVGTKYMKRQLDDLTDLSWAQGQYSTVDQLNRGYLL
jgi:hypothetical protein